MHNHNHRSVREFHRLSDVVYYIHALMILRKDSSNAKRVRAWSVVYAPMIGGIYAARSISRIVEMQKTGR